METALYHLDNVSFAYPSHVRPPVMTLHGVNLTIRKNKITAIMGASGSGKSTLLMLLSGLLKPSAGEIMSTVSFSGIVFQYSDQQFFSETVFEEAAFGPRNRGWNPEKVSASVNTALNLSGLSGPEFKSRSPFSLSAGQKRRLAVASVLSMQPDALLLDEPTAGLDLSGANAILEIITGLIGRNVSVVVVSHDTDLLWACADDVVLLKNGMIVRQETAMEFFSDSDLLRSESIQEPEVLRAVKQLQRNGRQFESVPRSEQELDILIKKQE